MWLATTSSRAGLLLLVICGIVIFSARAAAAGEDWSTLETPHFLIHYQAPAESLAKRTASIAEQVHQRITLKLNWVPRDKTHIVLSDASDQANGYVIPFPYNRSVLTWSSFLIHPS